VKNSLFTVVNITLLIKLEYYMLHRVYVYEEQPRAVHVHGLLGHPVQQTCI